MAIVLLHLLVGAKNIVCPQVKVKPLILFYDDPNITPPNEYRFDIACGISGDVCENAQGVIKKIIPAGLCAKYRLLGSDDRLGAVIQFLYSQWFSEFRI